MFAYNNIMSCTLRESLSILSLDTVSLKQNNNFKKKIMGRVLSDQRNWIRPGLSLKRADQFKG